MRILCATDLLAKSESAIDRSGILAERLNADLSLLHVVTPPEVDRMLVHDLRRASRQLQLRTRPPLWLRGPAPNVLVRSGSAARFLLQTAKEIAADLIVLGTHRKRSARDALAGTIAERVLSQHQCPVLIVKRTPKDAYGNILLALDRSASSTSALRAAESLVMKDRAVRATVVHALEPPYGQLLTSAGIGTNAITLYADAWKREASTVLRNLLEQASKDFARYEIILEEARPSAVVQRAAVRIDPDLLVLGTRGHSGIRRTLLGSVANRILAAANIDVLIVPDGGECGAARKARLDQCSLEVIAGT